MLILCCDNLVLHKLYFYLKTSKAKKFLELMKIQKCQKSTRNDYNNEYNLRCKTYLHN